MSKDIILKLLSSGNLLKENYLTPWMLVSRKTVLNFTRCWAFDTSLWNKMEITNIQQQQRRRKSSEMMETNYVGNMSISVCGKSIKFVVKKNV